MEFFQPRYLNALAEFATSGNRTFALASLGPIFYLCVIHKFRVAILAILMLLCLLVAPLAINVHIAKQPQNEIEAQS